MWQEQESREIPEVRPPTMVDDYSSEKSSRGYSPFLSVKYDDSEMAAVHGSPKSVQFKSPQSRPSGRTPTLTRNDAAMVIQKAWRTHVVSWVLSKENNNFGKIIRLISHSGISQIKI